jgi:hypothetical protein
MAAVRIALAALFFASVAGCALSDDTTEHDAGAAAKQVVEGEYVGDYGPVWDDLHPRHQRLVSRTEYEECRRSIDVVGTLESVLILDVHDAPLTVFGLPSRTPAKAVEVRVSTDETQFTATYHVVRVGDRWRWVLNDRAARGFARSDCPA